MLQCAAGCTAQVLPQRIVRRDSFSTGSAARVGLEDGICWSICARNSSKKALALKPCLDRAGAAESRRHEGRKMHLRPVVEQAGAL